MIKHVFSQQSPIGKTVLRRLRHFPVDEHALEPQPDDAVVESVLYASGRRVVHCNLSANYIYKSWQFSTTETAKVLQAEWVSFNDRRQYWLAVLVNSELLALFGPEGSHVDIPLPMQTESIWPLGTGILLQPREHPAGSSGAGLMLSKVGILSLSHPLDELKLVVCEDGTWAFSSSGERLLYADGDQLVTCNGIVHSFWLIYRQNVLHGENNYMEEKDDMGDDERASLKSSDSGCLQRLPNHVSSWRGARVRSEHHEVDVTSVHDAADYIVRHSHRCGLSEPARKIFTATDIQGAQLLCLLVGTTLMAVDRTGQCCFKMTGCLDAAPVTAMLDTPIVDIIFLRDCDKDLHLTRGDIPIARLDPPEGDWHLEMQLCRSGVTSRDTWSELEDVLAPTPVALTNVVAVGDAVGSRVTLFVCGDSTHEGNDYVTGSNEFRMIRVEVSLKSPNPGVQVCLDALETELEPSVSLAIRVATVTARAEAWQTFRCTMFILLGLQKPLHSTDPWQALLSSDYHAQFAGDCDWLFRDNPHGCNSPSMVPNVREHTHESGEDIMRCLNFCGIQNAILDSSVIVRSLHLVYEEWKLNLLTWRHVRPLGVFLSKISLDSTYIVRYRRDVLGVDVIDTMADKEYFFLRSDVHEWFSALIKHGRPSYGLETLPETLPCGAKAPGNRARRLASIFSVLDQEILVDGGNVGELDTARKLTQALVYQNFNQTELATWPPGFSLPIHDALMACRLCPASCWPVSAYMLIGRHDLACIQRNDVCGCEWLPQEQMQQGYTQCTQVTGMRESIEFLKRTSSHNRDANDPPGILKPSCVDDKYDEATPPHGDDDGLRFAVLSSSYVADPQMAEVCRLFQSWRPVFFRVERAPEMSDHDFEMRKQERLLQVCMRSCATPCGRAMLTIGSVSPKRTLTEPLPIPRMCLSGRTPPSSAVVSLDASAVERLGNWFHFHNGVAAGLRLCEKSTNIAMFEQVSALDAESTSRTRSVTRTWVLYNRPEVPSSEHGGLLLALGLQQQLHVLTMTDLYEYLTLGHDPTTVGILLGMAASKIGSGDTAVSKMLCLHIPALLPQPFADMEVSAVAQTAALAGVGLLYQGTAHRLMAEFLLGEISRRIPCDHSRDREAYSLAAGIALGMVILGLGTSLDAAGLGDIDIAERLHHAITGGRERARLTSDTSLRDGTRPHRWQHYARNHDPMSLATSRVLLSRSSGAIYQARGSSTSQDIGNNARSSRISEGEFVNTDITAPGAILALGLFFIQTNCQSAAKRLDLPDTRVLLDTVRPDFLLLRVVARSLIMWDHVFASPNWVEKQVPRVILSSVSSLVSDNSIVHCPIDGVARQRAEKSKLKAFDWDSVRQAHANILAGACFAMGLRFAGTGNEAAALTLQHYLMHFKALRSTFGTGENANIHRAGDSANVPSKFAPSEAYAAEPLFDLSASTRAHTSEAKARALRPDRPTVEIALGTTAIALGLVMCGTGDSGSLRLLRQLRRRLDKGTTFGTHQALHTAIGLLFMGCGQASLARTKEAVAALLCAFFPRFPKSPDDNQYHLQPLRHLWVLAVSWRGLRTLDVDSGHVVQVPLDITLRQSVDWAAPASTIRCIAPCLMPPLCDIASLSVASAKYYPFHLEVVENQQHARALLRLIVFVKRRAGHLSCTLSPVSSRAPLSAPVNYADIPLRVSCETSCAAVLARCTNDPATLMFARLFCNEEIHRLTSAHIRPLGGALSASTLNWNVHVLYECVAADKQHALTIYLQLHHYAQQLRTSACSMQAWSLRLCLEYFDPEAQLRQRLSTQWILRPEFVQTLRVHLGRAFEDAIQERAIYTQETLTRLIGCHRILASTLIPRFSGGLRSSLRPSG